MTDQDETEQTAGDERSADQAPEDEAKRPEEEVADQEGDEGVGETDADLDLWAAAMAEQEAAETADSETPERSDGGEEELWAAAMAEQEAQTPSAETEPPSDEPPASAPSETTASSQAAAEAAGDRVFRPLEQSGQKTESRDLEMILDIPVRLSVELGRTKVTIKQLLEMAQGSVVELDGLAGEPMDILINGYLIAQGEVVVVEDKYGIRITEIISPSERVQKLNR
ncbi:flagellar motor switch protein FliN [Halochromatium glycolicum]|uniref:Flagellar motor switch protein FliN n=2 Tax=Halochromatium glycolicum TaxID=85075 RepID=A0AAJ0U1C2_9GAMM|nr:flagellar motor switch protein FliN [Halochromatium glycolicum]